MRRILLIFICLFTASSVMAAPVTNSSLSAKKGFEELSTEAQAAAADVKKGYDISANMVQGVVGEVAEFGSYLREVVDETLMPSAIVSAITTSATSAATSAVSNAAKSATSGAKNAVKEATASATGSKTFPSGDSVVSSLQENLEISSDAKDVDSTKVKELRKNYSNANTNSATYALAVAFVNNTRHARELGEKGIVAQTSANSNNGTTVRAVDASKMALKYSTLELYTLVQSSTASYNMLDAIKVKESAGNLSGLVNNTLGSSTGGGLSIPGIGGI